MKNFFKKILKALEEYGTARAAIYAKRGMWL